MPAKNEGAHATFSLIVKRVVRTNITMQVFSFEIDTVVIGEVQCRTLEKLCCNLTHTHPFDPKMFIKRIDLFFIFCIYSFARLQPMEQLNIFSIIFTLICYVWSQ